MNIARQVLLQSKWSPIVISCKRSAGQWTKDWMPGPAPTTPEERAAAAKKYNLLPEEYEPSEWGDYPKLPDVSGASKDPHYNWDMFSIKKDYCETLHEHYNVICEERYDINRDEKFPIPPYKQVLYFIMGILSIVIPYHYTKGIKFALPHMKKHYPIDGTHYKYPKY